MEAENAHPKITTKTISSACRVIKSSSSSSLLWSSPSSSIRVNIFIIAVVARQSHGHPLQLSLYGPHPWLFATGITLRATSDTVIILRAGHRTQVTGVNHQSHFAIMTSQFSIVIVAMIVIVVVCLPQPFSVQVDWRPTAIN